MQRLQPIQLLMTAHGLFDGSLVLSVSMQLERVSMQRVPLPLTDFSTTEMQGVCSHHVLKPVPAHHHTRLCCVHFSIYESHVDCFAILLLHFQAVVSAGVPSHLPIPQIPAG